MSRLGMADVGVATLNDMRDNAAMIASLDRTVPLIADADTGYGGRTPPRRVSGLKMLSPISMTDPVYCRAAPSRTHSHSVHTSRCCSSPS